MRPCLLWTVALVAELALIADAADRVTLRPENSTGLVTLSGEILDYTDETLTLRSERGVPAQVLSASEVAAVETYRTPSHLNGLRQMAARDVDAAILSFQSALKTEAREWMRREILAELVQCFARQGDLPRAAMHFVQIAESEPHHRHWGIAPLLWSPEPVSPALAASARRWLVASSEATRLVGASLLLGETATRVAAIAELKRQERASDSYLGSLAQALLWNATLSTNVSSPEEMNRWERDVERMPESIRGGPWYVVAQARLHRQEPEEAVAALLRVLLVHNRDERLAAQAGEQAARTLTELNRDEEARRVVEIVVERYPWSPSSQAARKLLKPTGAPDRVD